MFASSVPNDAWGLFGRVSQMKEKRVEGKEKKRFRLSSHLDWIPQNDEIFCLRVEFDVRARARTGKCVRLECARALHFCPALEKLVVLLVGGLAKLQPRHLATRGRETSVTLAVWRGARFVTNNPYLLVDVVEVRNPSISHLIHCAHVSEFFIRFVAWVPSLTHRYSWTTSFHSWAAPTQSRRPRAERLSFES